MRNIFGIHINAKLSVEPLGLVDWFKVKNLKVEKSNYSISWKKGEKAEIHSESNKRANNS